MSKKNMNDSIVVRVQNFTKVFANEKGDVCMQREYTGGQRERRMSKGDAHRARQVAKLMATGLTYAEAMEDTAK
jgi:hypothetical protein